MNMMEVVPQTKGKYDTYQREALIELENLVLDTEKGRITKYRHLHQEPRYKYAWNIYADNEF